MTKKCFKCNRNKPLTEFYKHSGMKDGRLNKCKECSKFDTKLNRKNNIEYYREYDKNRAMLPHRVDARKAYTKTKQGKESKLKTIRKYRSLNPIKYKAHTAVNNAVRDGILIKPKSCSECGSKEGNIHGHHDDYSRVLDVRWICAKCHKEWHDLNGEAKGL